MTNITPTGNTPNPLPTPPPGGAKKPPSKKDEMSDLARQNLPFKEDEQGSPKTLARRVEQGGTPKKIKTEGDESGAKSVTSGEEKFPLTDFEKMVINKLYRELTDFETMVDNKQYDELAEHFKKPKAAIRPYEDFEHLLDLAATGEVDVDFIAELLSRLEGHENLDDMRRVLIEKAKSSKSVKGIMNGLKERGFDLTTDIAAMVISKRYDELVEHFKKPRADIPLAEDFGHLLDLAEAGIADVDLIPEILSKLEGHENLDDFRKVLSEKAESSEIIKEILEGLKERGFDPSPIGSYAPTRAFELVQEHLGIRDLTALKVASGKNGPIDTVVDQELIARLNVGHCHIRDLGLSNEGLLRFFEKNGALITYFDASKFNMQVAMEILKTCPNLQQINLRNCKIHETTAITLADILKNMQNLHSLDISYNFIRPKGAAAIGQLKNLTSLDISNNQIGRYGALEIGQLTNLTTLNILGNELGPLGAQALRPLKKNLTFLNIGWNNLGPDGARAVSKFMKLTSLVIYVNGLGPEGAQSISRLEKLKVLDINNNGLGSGGAQALRPLKKTLTSLNIAGNSLGTEGAIEIGQFINLTSLDLSFNNLGPDAGQEICKLKNLESLNIGNNHLGHNGAQPLYFLENLTSLNIEENNIGPEGGKDIGQLTNLTSLNISSNNLGPDAVQEISQLKNLESLDIGYNNLDHDRVHYLYFLKNLTSLNIEYSDIGPQGVKDIGQLTNLTSLNIENNSIGHEGAEEIGHLKNLTSLNIESNNLGTRGVKALHPLKNLTSLNIANNDIGDEGALAISQFVHLIDRLTSLNISENHLSPDGIQALTQLVHLKFLDISEDEAPTPFHEKRAIRKLFPNTKVKISSM